MALTTFLLTERPDLETAWEQFVQEHPDGTLFHTLRWRRAIRHAFGFADHYLLAVDSGRVAGVLPLFLRRDLFLNRCLVSVAGGNYGGFCGNAAARAALWEHACRLSDQLDVAYLEMRRLSPPESAPSPQYCTTLVDLTRDDLLRHCGRSVRRYCHRARRCGLTFRIAGSEGLTDFHRLYRQNSRQLGSPHFGRAYFTELFAAFPGNSHIALAECSGRVIAADFLVQHKRTLYSLQSGTDLAYYRDGANYFIVTESMCYARTRGCHLYDFGRSVPGGGTHLFKQHWRGMDLPLAYTYYLRRGTQPDFSPHSARYRLPRLIWQHLPAPVTAFLGPFLTGRLH